MKSFMKRLWSDRRGNALMIAGGALPLLIGSVGLAVDTVQWALWKRQLQRAADSAAYAGVYQKFQNGSASAGVAKDLANNNHLWVPLLANYPQVSEPADTATYVKQVEVSLAVQEELSFSSMFMSAAPIVMVTARAAAIDSGEFCVVALESTTNSGIIIQGSTNVNLGCGMISNSPSASVSVGVNGTAHNVTADPVAGAGGVPDINGVSTEQSYHLAQPDPFENKYDTTVPAGTSCGNMNSHVVTPAPTAGVTTLRPGCYTGNNQFKFTGGITELRPGTYYLKDTDFDAQGGTIRLATGTPAGQGVTIILTGSSPGQLKLNGNATIQLKAPTTGTFAKMLFIQSTLAPDSNNANILNGSNTSFFDGTVYFPKQQVTFSGSTAATTKCAMVVARRVEFAGNSNIQNNTTGCQANQKVPGKTIRLIA